MGVFALMMFGTTIISAGIFYLLYKWIFREFREE